MSIARAGELAELGVLRVHGPDALRFLQGQLSQDMERLASGAQLAGYHNPQGRVIALLHLVRTAPDEILAVLPRSLLASVLERLRRYVLRAKVSVSDASASFRVRGVIAAHVPADVTDAGAAAGSGAGAAASAGAGAPTLQLPVDATRALVLSPGGGPSAAPGAATADDGARLDDEWTRLDVAAGRPQLYPATSEAFVAQMLNLDLIGAIAFDKGCYTGQEVIARAHYRGRVKRRMQRFRSLEPARLAPGDRARAADGRALHVVIAAPLADGRCEFLAVAPVPLEGAPGTDAATETEGAADEGTGGATAIMAEPLPLPYALP